MRLAPARVADSPSTFTINRGSKMITPKKAPPMKNSAALAVRNTGFLNRPKLRMGFSWRRLRTTNSASASVPPASSPSVSAPAHGCSARLSCKATTTGPSPAISKAAER